MKQDILVLVLIPLFPACTSKQAGDALYGRVKGRSV